MLAARPDLQRPLEPLFADEPVRVLRPSDGFELVVALRSSEAGRTRMPIVALTATALVSEAISGHLQIGQQQS